MRADPVAHRRDPRAAGAGAEFGGDIVLEPVRRAVARPHQIAQHRPRQQMHRHRRQPGDIRGGALDRHPGAVGRLQPVAQRQQHPLADAAVRRHPGEMVVGRQRQFGLQHMLVRQRRRLELQDARGLAGQGIVDPRLDLQDHLGLRLRAGIKRRGRSRVPPPPPAPVTQAGRHRPAGAPRAAGTGSRCRSFLERVPQRQIDIAADIGQPLGRVGDPEPQDVVHRTVAEAGDVADRRAGTQHPLHARRRLDRHLAHQMRIVAIGGAEGDVEPHDSRWNATSSPPGR